LPSKGSGEKDDYLLKPLSTNEVLGTGGRSGSYMHGMFRLGTNIHHINDPTLPEQGSGKMTPD